MKHGKAKSELPLELRDPVLVAVMPVMGLKGIGDMTGSDKDGNGFTLWIEDENVYQKLSQKYFANHTVKKQSMTGNTNRRATCMRDNE